MRLRTAALLWTGLVLLGCNQILGIEQSEIAANTEQGVACDSNAQCELGEACVAGHCRSLGDAAMDARVPESPPPKTDAGDAARDSGVDARDAGDAGDGQTAPPTGPDAIAPECESGKTRCEGAAQIERSECVDGFWKAAGACENGELCDTTTGECEPVVAGCSGREPGDAFCMGRERVVCGPDLVTAERETCPTIEHCTGSVDGKCLPCVGGEHKCDGNALQSCNADRNGFETVETCNDAPCNADLRMCTSLVCNKDAYSCNTATNTLRLCNSDGTAYLQETPCNAGICDAEHGQCDKCAPNEFGCTSGTDVAVCDGDGQNLTMESCTQLTTAATPLCNDLKDACVACIAPSTTCVDRGRQQSCTDDGTWGTAEACVNQTCYQGKCAGHCGPNVPPKCASGGGSEACGDDGEWHTVETAAQCPVCIGDGMCVDCTSSDTKCDGLTRQSTCVNNGWDVPVSCSNKTCVGKACRGECAQGQSKCEADGRYTCNTNGDWVKSPESCPICQMEAGGARCVTCRPDDYLCMTRDLYKCKADQSGWDFVNRCDSAALCDQTHANGHCINQDCNPREVTCNGNVLETCNTTGSAHTSMTCSGQTPICDADGNGGMGQCDRCNEGQVTCASFTQRSVCSSDGQTLTTPSCTGSTPACLNGTCTECNKAATPTKCDSLTAVRACQDNGSWGAATTCVDTTCTGTAQTCTGNCAQGQARCSNGLRETCQSSGAGTGLFGNAAACPGIGGVCTGAGVCRECSPTVTRCDGTTRQYTCSGSSTWGSSTPCTNKTCFGDAAGTGLGGSCRGSCAPGQRMCVSGARAWDPCGSTGEPDSTQRTTCNGTTSSASWDVCRDVAGARTAQCVAAQEVRVGYPDAAQSGQQAGLLNHEWLFQPVTFTGPGRFKLTHLSAVIANLTSGAKSFQMAIYNSRSGSGLQGPNTRETQTSPVQVVSGNNTMATAISPLLSPGTYWIGVKVFNGQDNQDPVGNLNAYEVASGPFIFYTQNPKTDPPSSPLPTTLVPSTGYQLGVYATGKYEL